ncbi:xanthine dehydrogenase accessory protein XdhC [Aquibium microcysteis]|uniref:xanthine dehydrogenase accessory protein XdhC n=1 Tax=Aquibium microcysteis TaxID=675281 RepID=UPI00165D062A|nr:xanthine dehydrogenase accessory protein XdhC [Aquibium microcysteis]
MSVTAPALRTFLDTHPQVARVRVSDAKGSTPREAGAWMLVSPTEIFGTIGGGQLEFMAIDEAREMLRGGSSSVRGRWSDRPRGSGAASPASVGDARFSDDGTRRGDSYPPADRGEPLVSPVLPTPARGRGAAPFSLSIPLGPEIGQCCGGRVDLSISPVSDADRTALVEAAEAEDARLPTVLVFGGGHVGRALAQALALLPVRATVVETRADAVEGFPPEIPTRLTAVPEGAVRAATPGAAFVVLTHDHALDFLIVAEALRRGDAAYVGMIGSKTKKATFRSWFLNTAEGNEDDLARLVSPIGGGAVRDKRPAVIAALAAAEIMTALAQA